MKRIILTTGLLAALTVASYAQSPANVKKAVRFRHAVKSQEVVVDRAQQVELQELGNATTNSLEHQSNAAQLKELGSRYADGWGENAAQLKELGSRYADGWGE